MTLINIKFNPEMERAIIEGRKCCTTRDEIKGNIGDLFRVKDRMYRIIQVDEIDLFDSSAMANAEGFKSDIEYLDCMSEIYPDLVECSPVFIHYFAYAGEWCPLGKSEPDELPEWFVNKLNESIIDCGLLEVELKDDNDIEEAVRIGRRANTLRWVLSLRKPEEK